MRVLLIFIGFLIILITSSCSRCYTPYWSSCYSVEVVEPCGAPVSTYLPYSKCPTPYYYAVPPGYVGSSMYSTPPSPPIPEDTTTIYTPLPF